MVFQDRPCPIDTDQRNESVRQQAPDFPLSIHASWFEIPAQAEERAFCDRNACECGKLEKRHKGALAQAVADALYMDGSWHRYESSVDAWLQAPASSAKTFDLREQMIETTCNIMMAQTILRTYASDVVNGLKQRKRTAEERGFDVEGPCIQGIPDACEYLASIELYERLKTDATALQRKRGENDLQGAAHLIPGQASADE